MNTRRMFFAIWPNEAQIDQLYSIQSDYVAWGREVLPENFHITLLFLGNISDAVTDCLAQSMQTVLASPFKVQLDRLGYFEKTKIFWVGPTTIPQELESLFKGVRNCAQRCGISKLSKRYTPHVTLLRKSEVPVSNPNFMPIEWPVNEFHLVESRTDRDGARYYTVDSFPLTKDV